MELVGAMVEGEWASLSGMYSTDEADFMAQLLNLPSEHEGSSGFWPPQESVATLQAAAHQDSFHSLDDINSNLYYAAGGENSIPFRVSRHEDYCWSDSHQIMVADDTPMSMDISMDDQETNFLPISVISRDAKGTSDGLNEEVANGGPEESGGNLSQSVLPDKDLQLEGRSVQVSEPGLADKYLPSENSKKRPRSSGDIPKPKRNAKLKKSPNPISTANNGDEGNAGLNGNGSSSCCSEDDSFASQELNGGVSSSSGQKGVGGLSPNSKTRASRGSATDPQSLYARKRRERINERLRILQNLVPNGTKVDISTMLEEAVQYVKFLQLQIKLLSSDDLWMYAPIAYNGMNIGLDLNIAVPR